MNYPTGLRLDLTNERVLQTNSVMLRTYGLDDAPLPESVNLDVHHWLAIHNQSPFNSCGGHALSTINELLNYFHNNDRETQLSRWFAYIQSQNNGPQQLRNVDQGITIESALVTAKESGIVPEAMLQYPTSYHANIPAECLSAARPHVCENYAIMPDERACARWLATRQGGLLLGVPCGNNMFNCKRILQADGPDNGGHAIAVVGYETVNGERHYRKIGSWGTQWAENGTCLIPARVMDWWCKAQPQSAQHPKPAVVSGLTDLQGFVDRTDTLFVDDNPFM